MLNPPPYNINYKFVIQIIFVIFHFCSYGDKTNVKTITKLYKKLYGGFTVIRRLEKGLYGFALPASIQEMLKSLFSSSPLALSSQM